MPERDKDDEKVSITAGGDDGHRGGVQNRQELQRESSMPILMLAVLALAAFGAIGILLATAVILEQRSQQKRTHAAETDAVTGQKPAV
jgi:hypothetical protein